MSSNLYSQVYFHAVRRAMLENEQVLKKFMETVAKDYDDAQLQELDELLVAIDDNDLFDVVMGHTDPEKFAGRYNVPLLIEIRKITGTL